MRPDPSNSCHAFATEDWLGIVTMRIQRPSRRSKLNHIPVNNGVFPIQKADIAKIRVRDPVAGKHRTVAIELDPYLAAGPPGVGYLVTGHHAAIGEQSDLTVIDNIA